MRKILTLHIPITEYDTLGSESDNECSAKSLKQSKYKSQRGLSFEYLHECRGKIFLILEAVEETSSSSENSPSNVSRKHKPSYPTRKSAKPSAMMKRHVRSSSGYSSHNEETTFSIANYPNADIGPPSRFSDAASVDSSYDKREKTSNSPRVRGNQKFQREAFQINV